MKRRKRKVFTSVDEIVQAYLPDYAARTTRRSAPDPGRAGERLAERLMATMRSDIAKSLGKA